MVHWGISALSHDASLAVVADDDRILFAAHAERYSRKKNDALLHQGLIDEALAYGVPERIAWYERPMLKKLRHLRAGQWKDAATAEDLPGRYLRSLDLPFRVPEIEFADHHASHAAAGFATSGFEDAVVIIADSIGEFRTFSIAEYDRAGEARLLHARSYPHSLGLLYSAFTKRCGFKPNEDEYIVMGMAALGSPVHVDRIREELLEITPPSFRLKLNPHHGIGDWMADAKAEDLAASIQAVLEEVMVGAAVWARGRSESRNLILGGGVALNCAANAKIARQAGFDDVWIFPNPGDAGSSVGAVAAVRGGRLRWEGPYLGTEIAGEYPVEALVKELASNGIAAVASGRAEFGPRALGNRSLLADPRPLDMKDRVNVVKGREPFRPFAPIVRAERAHELFDMPVKTSPYMQFVAPCRFPDEYPSITHLDGTSRVQTVARDEHPDLYRLLEAWEAETGCPLLLNTSLNVKGEPLVNTRDDAARFQAANGVRVY